MRAASQKQLVEGSGAGVFVQRGNSETRLQEEDFHLAFTEPVLIWFTPTEYREEKTEEVLAVAKRLHSVREFRFPNVSVPVSVVTKIRSDFPKAKIEGIR